MKKIFAIIVSLLFVVSLFGVTQTMAQLDCCTPENFEVSRTSVHVGETFTVSFRMFCGMLYIPDDSLFELTHINIYDETGALRYSIENDGQPFSIQVNGMYLEEITLRAIRPGTVFFGLDCSGFTCQVCDITCDCHKTVTITPKEYPMLKFMKILEKNKNKE
ncbi:MAG: hypothetical protein HPY60_03000 [Candidatus Methanofastidiosum sp.]|nr:hypothetical protein [Methanofastidiosum sp.]